MTSCRDRRAEVQSCEIFAPAFEIRKICIHKRLNLQIFDENLDGFVTLNELQAAWRTAAAETQGAVSVPSDDVLRAMIAEADTDGDGKLSEEEFLNVIEQCA